jgi:RNA polymerase sigma-70 factor (ECF subfamily)
MDHEAASAGLEGDIQLVRRMAAGDPRALGALCDRYGATAYALACAVTSVPSVAETAVTDAFAQLWREAPTFDSQRMSVFAWLMSIVRSRALEARPRDVVIPRVLSAQRRDGDVADRVAATSGRSMTGATTLDGLPARAVELAYFGGMSKRQIASELQLTEGAVAQLLRCGAEALRASLPRTDTRWSSTSAELGAHGATSESRR